MEIIRYAKIAQQALEVLKKGQELRSAAAWKNVQVIASALAALLVLLRLFGVDLGISDEEIAAIAGGIVAVVNIYFTLATSRKVGIPANDLPPIELIGRSESDSVQSAPMPSRADTEADKHDGNEGGWNG